MISAAHVGDNELSFTALADVAEVGFLGAVAGWLSGADKKEKRAKQALAVGAAAQAEADDLASQANAILSARQRADAAATQAKRDVGLLADLRSPSATGLPVAGWAVAAGGATLAWAVAPGRLAIPAALAAGVMLAWWDHRHKAAAR